MIRFVLSVISVNLYNDQTRCFVDRMGKYFSSLLGLSSGYVCQFSPQFHPVLMVSGQTVALGGFWEDEALLFEMQAAEMAASHDPKWGCSPEEVAIAECVEDPTPWRHRVYRASNQRMIEPRGFDFSDVNFFSN